MADPQTQGQRERASTERTEGRDEERRGGVLVRAGACGGPLQAVSQNRALVFLFFFSLPSSSFPSPPPLAEQSQWLQEET